MAGPECQISPIKSLDASSKCPSCVFLAPTSSLQELLGKNHVGSSRTRRTYRAHFAHEQKDRIDDCGPCIISCAIGDPWQERTNGGNQRQRRSIQPMGV